MTEETESVNDQASEKYCGIIMPISPIADCSAEHWSEVHTILNRAIQRAGLIGRMVNESEDVAIIHRNIVQNIYNDPIIICDVSHRNPNVMLELGMRLAFGKHIVIVKDDRTEIPFDASVIEFILYPRDLRFPVIETFIKKLSDKIKSTYQASIDGKPSTFLNHFSNMKVANLNSEEVDLSKFIDVKFNELSAKVDFVSRQYKQIQSVTRRNFPLNDIANAYEEFCSKKRISEKLIKNLRHFQKRFGISNEQVNDLIELYNISENGDDIPF